MKFDKLLQKIVLNDIKCNNPVMLLGEVGIGKSSWVESFAKNVLNSKCFTLACNQLAEKADLTGQRLMPKEDGKGYTTMFFPHEIIDQAIDYAKSHPTESPILFLDEINRTTSDTTSAILSLITARKIGTSDLPNNLVIISAGNDKGNIVALDEASITRFSLYHVEPDLETFLKFNPNLNPYIAQTLKENPNLIFCKRVPKEVTSSDDENENDLTWSEDDFSDMDEMHPLTTCRTITALSKWLNNFSTQDILDLMNQVKQISDTETISLLEECVIAKVGDTLFSRNLLVKLASITMQNPNQTTITINEPLCFDKMRNALTVQELENYIATLSDKEKLDSLLFALHDDNNNENIILSLSKMVEKTSQDFLTKFFTANQEGLLDEDNLDIYFSTNSDLANQLSQLI